MKTQYWALLALAGYGLADKIVTPNTAVSNCPPLGAVLPPPKKPSKNEAVKKALSQIQGLQEEVGLLFGNATGVAVSLSSAYEDDILGSLTYTPAVYNTSGTHAVDGGTVFMIASVSKVFTAMGLLLLGENISFSDPITKYVPELNQLKRQQSVQNEITIMDWDHITIDAMASHLGGVSGNLGNDLANDPAFNPKKYGLPDLPPDGHSECGALASSRPCTWKDFWTNFGRKEATYGPYTTPAYSDVAYDILGLVIERVSGEPYGDFVQSHIFKPLNMTNSYASKPKDDSVGFISHESNYWSTSMGYQQADGGLYSSANDLAKFGQAILNYTLVDEIRTKAWLKPRTHTSSLGISVGAPWEICRANNLTVDGRIIDVYSRIGDIPDYNALFAVIPDYGLSMSVLSAGPKSNLDNQLYIATQVLQPLVRSLEAAGKEEARLNYAGRYENLQTNSSIELRIDEQSGLHVKNWIMNGHDVLEDYASISSFGASSSSSSYLSIRMFPTGLESRNHSAWRAVYSTLDPSAVQAQENAVFFLQSGCRSWETIDNLVYGYNAFDEFVFGFNGTGDSAISIRPRAFQQTLTRV